jgi:hypothetical protein
MLSIEESEPAGGAARDLLCDERGDLTDPLRPISTIRATDGINQQDRLVIRHNYLWNQKAAAELTEGPSEWP